MPEGDPYAGGLAQLWGAGGTFAVDIEVTAKGSGLDCTQVACSVVTRVDHRDAGDRTQDVRIPIAFESQDPGSDGGDGVDVPAGTVSYVREAEFTIAGRPLDVLLHPNSGKLYVGSDNIVDTADVSEQGLYALDPADGRLLGHIPQAPGSTGALAARVVPQIIAPLSGDDVVFHYPLRGIGTAKDGDAAAKGVWLTRAAVTGAGPGSTASTVLVAQGPSLSEVETGTGVVRRTLTLDGGSEPGVDTAHSAAWSTGLSGGELRRIDTTTFAVTATAQLPEGAVYFVEPDPETGNVWVGSGSSVLVYDRDAKLLATVEDVDRATAMAFDTSTHRAFVLREDYGNADAGADFIGSLQVFDSATFEKAAEPLALPGSRANTTAGVAVPPAEPPSTSPTRPRPRSSGSTAGCPRRSPSHPPTSPPPPTTRSPSSPRPTAPRNPPCAGRPAPTTAGPGPRSRAPRRARTPSPRSPRRTATANAPSSPTPQVRRALHRSPSRSPSKVRGRTGERTAAPRAETRPAARGLRVPRLVRLVRLVRVLRPVARPVRLRAVLRERVRQEARPPSPSPPLPSTSPSSAGWYLYRRARRGARPVQ